MECLLSPPNWARVVFIMLTQISFSDEVTGDLLDHFLFPERETSSASVFTIGFKPLFEYMWHCTAWGIVRLDRLLPTIWDLFIYLF